MKIGKRGLYAIIGGVLVITASVSLIVSKAGFSESAESTFRTAEGYYEGELELSKEDEEWIDDNVIQIDNQKELNKLLNEEQESGNVDLDKDVVIDFNRSPNEVDNSNSIYFPEIGDQGSVGSCVAWATGYYQFTYMMNRALDREAKNLKNVASPLWIYNFINDGKDGGSTYVDALKLLQDVGTVSIKTVPYDTTTDNFINNLHATEENFLEAFNYQVAGYYSVSVGDTDPDTNPTPITGPHDSDLAAIKAGLDRGEIFTASTKSRRWKFSLIQTNDQVPENKYYAGEEIITRSDGNIVSGHRITIVGYNDNIWVDINMNGLIEEGEKGAFKIANSWGSDWINGNEGFCWVSYDALNYRSSVQLEGEDEIDLGSTYRYPTLYAVTGMLMKESQKPSEAYLAFDVKTSYISAAQIVVSASDANHKKTKYEAVPFLNSQLFYAVGPFGPQGGKDESTGTFLVDLDNVIPEVTGNNVNDYSWSLEATDIYDDKVSLTVSNVRLINATDNTTYSSYEKSKTINNESASFLIDNGNANLATVYYSGFDNECYIHYTIDGEEWTTAPGERMENTTEVVGYNHKYVINLGQETSATVCFNDGNNNWDSCNGNNYVVGVGTYGVKNSDVNLLQVGNNTPSPDVTAEPDGDSTTIYYSGYAKPYIHYQVEGGQWTTAPGFAMESTSELSGYTHKYTIELNGASKATVCFNDGNNSWDSNNGSNYEFKAGTYAYKNGSIKKVTIAATATPAPTEIPNTLGAEMNIEGQIKPGSDVKISATVVGGYAPYSVDIGYTYNEGENIYLMQDEKLSTEGSVSVNYQTGKGGQYTFFVTITDALGRTKTKTGSYSVGSFTMIGMACDKQSPQYVGTTVDLDPVLVNYYMKDGSTPDVNINITNGIVSEDFVYNEKTTGIVYWTPKMSGVYTITSTSEDDLGQTAKHVYKYTVLDYVIEKNICTIYYDGYDTTYIHYKIDGGQWTTAPGVKMEASTEKSGYSHKITINMGEATGITACFNDGNGTWDNNGNQDYKFEAGTYKVSKGVVKKVNTEDNIVTIFYKGYSNPYIHYKPEGGNWTTAPGIAMEASSEESSYTHKIVLNIEDASYITACFNDGKGNWDSRNGANYTFEPGKFGYSNGKIYKLL